jgi:hypothetical protein
MRVHISPGPVIAVYQLRNAAKSIKFVSTVEISLHFSVQSDAVDLSRAQFGHAHV